MTMTTPTPEALSQGQPQAARLALFATALFLLLGSASLWLGIGEGAIMLWGFGAVSLLQVPLSLVVAGRLRDGLGNKGLDRERRTLRISGHLLRFLALGIVLASAAALFGQRSPETTTTLLGVAIFAVVLCLSLWLAKRGPTDPHPTLALDAARARAMAEMAAILVAGVILGRWFPWADAITGIILALRIFFEGRTLMQATTIQAACGGCGSGCG
ncbi:MAG: cation transporter [Holophaga sp.]|nr:cation transporter [Holophaga sp.]